MGEEKEAVGFHSYELTPFNLKENIQLSGIVGPKKLYKSEDGKLILLADAQYGLIDYDSSSSAKIADEMAILGFALDIGIRREKQLTYGHGYYFGTPFVHGLQSQKEVTQKDLDEEFLKSAVIKLNTAFQSGDEDKENLSIRLNNLFKVYNNARLLYPNFLNESYLNLIQIIDGLSLSSGALEFALWCANVSSVLNDEIFQKIKTVGVFASPSASRFLVGSVPQ